MSYTLVKKIAQGGMAEIFLAKKVDHKGRIKLWCAKRILSTYLDDSEFARMFRDEYNITKRFKHPNLIAIKEFTEIEKIPSIVMEYVPGTDIRDILVACEKSGKALSPAMASYLVCQAALGLHHTHTLKDEDDQPLRIVHRDVSPQNILVSYDGRVKVIDFGIADNEAKMNHTRAGVIKGKFSYMSPEQVTMQNVDARTDIFAIGVVLWEMLAMRKLFQGRNEVETIELIKNTHFRKDLRKLNKEVDDDLFGIVMKALHQDLSKRYASGNALAHALGSYIKKKHPSFTRKELSQFITTILKSKYQKTQEMITSACQPDKEESKKPAKGSSSSGSGHAGLATSKSSSGGSGDDMIGADFDVEAAFEASHLSSAPLEDNYELGPPESQLPSSLPAVVSSTESSSSIQLINSGTSYGEGGGVGGVGVQKGVYHHTHHGEAEIVEDFEVDDRRNMMSSVKKVAGMVAAILLLVWVTTKYVDLGSLSTVLQSKPEATMTFQVFPSRVKVSLNGNPVSNHYVQAAPYVVDVHEMPLGRHVFEFSREGYNPQTYTYNKSSDSIVNPSHSMIINLSPKVNPAKLRLSLSKDPEGAPLKFVFPERLIQGEITPQESEIIKFLVPSKRYVVQFSSPSLPNSFSCPLDTPGGGMTVEYAVYPKTQTCVRRKKTS